MKIRKKLVTASFAALLTHEVIAARGHLEQPMDHAEVAMESPMYADDNRSGSIGSSGPLRINVADEVNAADEAILVMSPMA
jgi:hypothetical protein